jgi:hypothetical protein
VKEYYGSYSSFAPFPFKGANTTKLLCYVWREDSEKFISMQNGLSSPFGLSKRVESLGLANVHRGISLPPTVSSPNIFHEPF